MLHTSSSPHQHHLQNHWYSYNIYKLLLLYTLLFAVSCSLWFLFMGFGMCYTHVLFATGTCHILKLNEKGEKFGKFFRIKAQVIVQPANNGTPFAASLTMCQNTTVALAFEYCAVKLLNSTKTCTYQIVDGMPVRLGEDYQWEDVTCWSNFLSYSVAVYLGLLGVILRIVWSMYGERHGFHWQAMRNLLFVCFRQVQSVSFELPDCCSDDEAIVWQATQRKSSKFKILTTGSVVVIGIAMFALFLGLGIGLHMLIFFAGFTIGCTVLAVALTILTYKCFAPKRYVITNKRVLLIEHMPGVSRVQELPLDKLEHVQVMNKNEHGNTGTVRFGQSMVHDICCKHSFKAAEFVNIDDPEKVAKMLTEHIHLS